MNQKQAKELVRSRLSDKRYEHTLNVKKMAVRLAKRYGVDEDKAALAACDEARLNYEQKVLEAFREVNDAVVTYRNVRTAAALKRDLQQAAQKYVELAQLQYFNGVINYLDVLDAQRKYFDAQIGLSNAVRDEHLAMVDLYKALGGGWGVERE